MAPRRYGSGSVTSEKLKLICEPSYFTCKCHMNIYSSKCCRTFFIKIISLRNQETSLTSFSREIDEVLSSLFYGSLYFLTSGSSFEK